MSLEMDWAGIWLSTYDYHSTGRNQMYSSKHYVAVEKAGDALLVMSLPGSADSQLDMKLSIDENNVLTEMWSEVTAQDGYYRGRRYHGAVQFVPIEPARSVLGKWVGFGKDGEVNTGPWRLEYQAPLTPDNVLAYNRPPSD